MAAGLPVLLAGILWSSPAWADPKDDARRHFVAALAAAQKGDYHAALDEFLAAQAAYPHPATLYNIARAYTDLGDLENALRYYQLYRDAAPDKAEDVDPVIAVIEARLRQQKGATARAGGAPSAAPGTNPATPATATPGTNPATNPASPPATSGTPSAPSPSPDAAPVATATPTGTTAAPGSEAERLRAIADELATLSARISAQDAERKATAAEPATATPTAECTTAPVAAAEPAPVEDAAAAAALQRGTFLSDAYQRVVVTASRYGQDPLDSPSTITILTDQDIRLSGATNVPDLLRRVPGIDVMALAAAQPDISIRGFNRELSNKVLVLVDGRSVYLDFLGNVLWGTIPLSLEEIERIEIIRGPGSAIYGANAVTGVINIITRTPGEGTNVAKVDVGAPGYTQADVVATGRKERTTWRASAGYHTTGRWSADVDVHDGDAVDPFFEDQDKALNVVRGDARVDRTFGKSGFASLSGGFSDGTDEFYAVGALGDYAFDFTTGFARGDVAYGPAHVRVFYNKLDATTGQWTTPTGRRSLDTYVDSDTLDAEAEALGEVTTGPVKHRLNAGIGYRYKRIGWGYLVGDDPIDEHHFAAFAQEEATIGPLALVGSFRADRHPLVPLKETLSPRGAAILRVARQTSIRVSGGTSFRSPTFLETYLDLDQPTSADGVYVHTRGDTSITPERILSGEIGVHDASTTLHTADATFYVNRVTNLISLTSVDPEIAFYDPDVNGFAAGTTGFENSDAVYTAMGGELDAKVFPADGLDFYGNLAIERVLEDENGVQTPDESTSTYKVNGGASWRTPFRTDLAADVSWVSAQTWRLREFDDNGALIINEEQVPARTILSARVAVRPFKDEALELAFTGWNLLALRDGGTFREHPKGQLVGARLFGSASWKF